MINAKYNNITIRKRQMFAIIDKVSCTKWKWIMFDCAFRRLDEALLTFPAWMGALLICETKHYELSIICAGIRLWLNRIRLQNVRINGNGVWFGCICIWRWTPPKSLELFAHHHLICKRLQHISECHLNVCHRVIRNSFVHNSLFAKIVICPRRSHLFMKRLSICCNGNE